jgi:hypothetical protein
MERATREKKLPDWPGAEQIQSILIADREDRLNQLSRPAHKHIVT